MAAQLDWAQIDTVLLDMDGTLLDLNYDNHIWNNVLPFRVAQRRHATQAPSPEQIAATGEQLLSHMGQVYGTLPFYSLSFWAEHTQLDMLALHREFAHLIRYRPSAERFLARLGQRGTLRVLATNADRRGLAVKHAACGIEGHLDLCVSSHDYGHAKESVVFWQTLHEAVGFDPARTLFIDDNDSVLKSAQAFGIVHLRTVIQPDLERPAKQGLNFVAFNDFAEIMPDASP